jgi:hypothetical protein
VESDVLGRGAQHVRVVLELTEPPVAVEAEQRPDGTGHVVVIDVLSGRCLADGAQAALLGQEVICLSGGDAVAASQVVGTRPADLFS